MKADVLRAQTLRKVTRRLVPFLALLYVLNILDRVNLGFARLTTMPAQLGLTPEIFDLGYGIFYFGYLVFEVPANLLLRRIGARYWIARIMITWGLVSSATMLVTGPWSFYLVRILLGVAEAGFFPGIVLYLTYWFPSRQRARVMAIFMTGSAIAGAIGNPLSGTIVSFLDQVYGLEGWQWLFLLEGLPSVLVGVLVLYVLTDRPEEAQWLSLEERSWLASQMSSEEEYRKRRHGADLLKAALDGRVWLLIGIYFTVAVGTNASGSYLPQLIRDRFPGSSKFAIGFLAALPHLCAVVAMVLLGANSDRTGQRREHVALAAFLAVAGWLISAYAASPWLALAGLCLAQAGMMSMLPTFWALPTAFLSGAAAAGGIALINSLANVGGLLGPTILGQYGLNAMSITLFLGGILALCVRHDPTLDKGVAP
jgi:ACS family tartrate transporter-like MFS transporter